MERKNKTIIPQRKKTTTTESNTCLPLGLVSRRPPSIIPIAKDRIEEGKIKHTHTHKILLTGESDKNGIVNGTYNC